MSFTSSQYLIFFAIVFSAYWLFNGRRGQNLILLTASYFFYGWHAPWHTLVLGASTTIDHFLALSIERDPTRKKFYSGAVIFLNLGVLAFFKYFPVFKDQLADFTGGVFLLRILLPIGLSFYTLKKIGYILDVARNTLKPTHNFIDFALYVSFFPQVVSGPIDRPQKLLPQIETPRTWKTDNLISAWPLLIMGLFKKIVVADSIKVIVDQIFTLQEPTKFLLLAGGAAFTLQILADFSAYTDLSRGFSYLLGFNTTENFNRPYLALNPSDFWNRWHISLSTWLRDYIFFPARREMLKRRSPAWMTEMIPPILTMLISGIWHGVGWVFLLWGLYHGVMTVLYQRFAPRLDLKTAGRFRIFLTWAVMFAITIIGWIIFRAPSISWLWQAVILEPLAGTRQQIIFALMGLSMTLFYAAPLLIKLWLDIKADHASWMNALYYAAASLSIIIYMNSATPDFIYFLF